jgi:outer membrane protein assembly factor BamB
VLLLVGAGLGFYLYKQHQGRDIRGSSTVEFVPTETAPPPKPKPRPKPGRPAALTRVDWPMYGYDEQRLRYLPSLLRPPFRAEWTFRGRHLLEFPPAVAYGRVYIANNPGVLFAVQAATGRTSWRYRSGRCTAASPAVAGGLVYMAFLNLLRKGEDACNVAPGTPGIDGEVVAFDARTGRRLFVGSYDHHLYALDARTGALIWRASAQDRLGSRGTFYSTPAAAYGRVYIGSTDGKVYSFGAASGELRWSQSTGGYVYASPAVWKERILVGSYSGTFYALDAATGDVRWKFEANGPISGSASVIGNIVYFSTLKGRTYALNAATGRRIWSFPDGQYSPVVAGPGRLYLTGYTRLYGMVPS